MDVNIIELNYPIWQHNKKWAWSILKEKKPMQAEEKYIKEGWKDIYIIDESLFLYKINSIEIIKPAGLWGFSLKYSGKYFYVKNKYKLKKKLNLLDVKIYIKKFIEKNPNVYDSGLEIKELLKKIEIASSFKEIIKLLP